MRRALAIATVLASLAFGVSSAQALTPPIVKGSWPTGVGTETATLRAEIDPGGLATTYLFEYTTEADFRTKGFIDATKVPQLGVSIGKGLVFQLIDELVPNTAYRFRAVATNNLGTTVGKVRALRTDELEPIFTLPDDRGWEMVSPVDKNGGEIQSFGAKPRWRRAAGRGPGGPDHLHLGLLLCQSARLAGAEPVPLHRGATGNWATENITLPMLAGTYPESPTSGVPYRLFSSDLAGALVSNGRRCRTSAETQCPVANAPLPGSGAPAGYRNFYLRSGAGSFKALLTTTPAIAAEDFEVDFAGASPDLAHVVLSSCAALTPEATEVPGLEGECDPAAQNLYERSGSTLRLINLLPGQSTGTPGASLAAQSRAISANGSRVYWSDGSDLYLRDGTVTKKVADGASFQTASLDGSFAFYTAGEHLFRYTAATGAVIDLTPSGDVTGVVGAGEDGAFVYFLTSAGLFLTATVPITTLVAPQADPASAPPATGNARVSADGRRIAFLSTAELTPYDNRHIKTDVPLPEVYLFAAPGTAGAGTTCLSCNPSGERPIGPADLPGASANGQGPLAPHVYKPRVLSADSKRVFFDSFDSLAVSDTNADRDVYQWEATGTGHCTRPSGCVDLISSGRSEGGASFIDASADASDAFFLTDGSLVPSDLGDVDVYDARIGGGFPTNTLGDPLLRRRLPGAAAGARRRRRGLGFARKRPATPTPVVFKPLRCKKNEIKKLGRCVKKRAKKKP